jgi:hypothetical protein
MDWPSVVSSRLNMVSGKPKMIMMRDAAVMAALSHQKEGQPVWSAMAPAMMGAT